MNSGSTDSRCNVHSPLSTSGVQKNNFGVMSREIFANEGYVTYVKLYAYVFLFVQTVYVSTVNYVVKIRHVNHIGHNRHIVFDDIDDLGHKGAKLFIVHIGRNGRILY